MKILLLGDFSGLHANLASGLKYLGHSVHLASSGDGWKRIDADQTIPNPTASLVSKIAYRVALFRLLLGVRGYDIVQLVHPCVIPQRVFPKKLMMRWLCLSNRKVFLLACGSDAFYWAYGGRNLSYSPHADSLKFDYANSRPESLSENAMEFNRYLTKRLSGIIPVMFEYQRAYLSAERLKPIIRLPLSLPNGCFEELLPSDKIVVFHGLSRYGFKGTRHIEAAFRYLSNRYSSRFEILVTDRLPLVEYLQVMRRVHIVVDQANSYTYALNALHALSLGKVVLSGAEPEALVALGVVDCPIVNIKPDWRHIAATILSLSRSWRGLRERSVRGPYYVRKYHDSVEVAREYVQVWGMS